MLISYSMPVVTSIELTGGTWLTEDDGDACCDGRPARKARLQWDAGTSLGSCVEIRLNFASEAILRVFGLLGSTLPPGVRIVIGSTAAEARTDYMQDATVGAWLVAPEDIRATSCAIRIYNNCNGEVWANSSNIIDIGELWAGPAVEIPADAGWSLSTVEPSDISRSRAAQVNVNRQSAYRVLSCAFSPQPSGTATVRGAGLANGMDWEKLAAALRGYQRCVAIAQVKTVEGINNTAIYGVAQEIGETQHLRGQFFRKPMVFAEIPAR